MRIADINGRVTVSLLEADDADELEGLRRDFTGFRGEWLYRGTAADFIRSAQERFRDGGGFWAAIREDGSFAGVVGLSNLDRWRHCAEIDYLLGTAFRGRGLMTRAVRALVTHAFEELDLRRLEIKADAENHASCAIPERLGFAREGVLRRKIFYGSGFGDQAIYGMLREEWRV